MPYRVEIIETSKTPTLVRRCTTPAAEIGACFLAELPRVLDVALARSAGIAGPPFIRYFAVTDDACDIEIGLPVAKAVEGDTSPGAGVLAGELPAAAIARTIHVGDYARLGEAHEALRAWAVANGRTPSGAIQEHYVSDPSEGDDPAHWRTEVCLPMAR